MEKLLVICGPTATGKTGLALQLAKKFEGELVSADSRQVYKGMDIGTGKDLPENSKFEFRNSKLGGVYEVDGVSIWGYDLVSPTEEFSVGQYIKIAEKIFQDIWARRKLPILVGGSGLYIKAVVDGLSTAIIPRNKGLRNDLETRKVSELFKILFQVDSTKALALNSSDRKNPRRLIRAIEISNWKLNNKGKFINRSKSKLNTFFIGLKLPFYILKKRISARVNKRLEKGLEKEITKLMKSKVGWNHQSMDTLGYKEWKDYFMLDKPKNIVLQEWIKDESNYAKRQMTWFKKDKRINWFDITQENWKENVENLVKKWHNSSVKVS